MRSSLFVIVASMVLAKPVQGIDIVGAGATFPQRAYADAISSYKLINPANSVSYAGLGSSSGRCRLEDYSTKCRNTDTSAPFDIDFAGSDNPASSSEYIEFPDLQMYPTLVGAVVPIINLPGLDSSMDFVLTPVALAQIFRGEIVSWNDTRIWELQSAEVKAVLVDIPIEVVVRNSGSGTTEIFKSALSSFEAAFESQIGSSSSNTWSGVVTTQVSQVASYVLGRPYSIGHVVLSEALSLRMVVPLIFRNGHLIAASTTSVSAAAAEKGADFGNNGDDPSRLTANLFNTVGASSWPICGYTYLVMRKDTLRSGATCANRLATVQFWDWFYTSSVVIQLAENEGFAMPSAAVLKTVLSRFRADILCEGHVVYIPPAPNDVTIHGDAYLGKVITTTIRQAYAEEDDAVTLVYDGLTSVTNAKATGGVHFTTVPHGYNLGSGLLKFDYMDVGLAVIYNICSLDFPEYCGARTINLGLTTLAGIYSGRITQWNDAEILAFGNSHIASLGQPIVVYAETVDSEVMVALSTALKKVVPSFATNESVLHISSSDAVNRLNVYRVPFFIAVSPLFGASVSSFAKIAVVLNEAGNPSYPLVNNIAACNDGPVSMCYPLYYRKNIVTKTDYTGDACREGVNTANFLLWTIEQSALIGLAGAVDRIDTKTALFKLSRLNCDGVSILAGVSDDIFLPGYAKSVGYAAVFTGLSVLAGLAVWITVFRRHKIVVNSQPVFMYFLLIGGSITLCSIFPMLQDDQTLFHGEYEADHPSLDAACMAQVWLYFIGLTMSLSALLIKTWRIIAIFGVGDKQLRRKAITVMDVLPTFFGCLLLVSIVLLVWQVVSPLKWVRTVTATDQNGYPAESAGYCESDTALVFLWVLIAIMMLAYLYGNYLSFLAHRASTKLVESQFITLAMVSGMQTYVLTLPLVLLQYENADILLLGKVMNVFLQVMALCCFIFLPKFYDFIIVHMEGGDAKVVMDQYKSGETNSKASRHSVMASMITSMHSRHRPLVSIADVHDEDDDKHDDSVTMYANTGVATNTVGSDKESPTIGMQTEPF